jgi:hypothetical protein
MLESAGNDVLESIFSRLGVGEIVSLSHRDGIQTDNESGSRQPGSHQALDDTELETIHDIYSISDRHDSGQDRGDQVE